MSSSRLNFWRPALAACASVVLVLVAYRDALSAGFVFDDHVFLQLFCWQVDSFSELLDVPEASSCGYRPVRYLSLALDHVLWGPDPFGFHLTNLILHGLVVVLVFLLLRRLHLGVVASAVGAVLWGLHPVNTDAVTYVAGRRDVLSTLLFMLALMAWPRRWSSRLKGWLRVGLTAGLFVLAFQTKEMAVTLVAIIVLEALFAPTLAAHANAERPAPSPWRGLRERIGGRLWAIALMLALAVAGFIYRGILHPLTTTSDRLWGGDLAHHLLTIPAVYAKYAELIVLPWRLYGDYSDYPPASGLTDPRVWLGLLVLSAIWVGGVTQATKRPYLAFGLLWLGVTMLPVSQIVPHHELVAEHYLYLPLIGLAVPAARAVQLAAQARRHRVIAALGVSAVIVAFAARVHDRNQDYTSEETFALEILRHVPGSIRGRLTLAHALQQQHRFDEAVPYLEDVMAQTEPPSRFHRTALANLLSSTASLGDLERAQRLAYAMRRHYPTDPYGLRMLGTVLVRNGQRDKGLLYQQRARDMAPNDMEGRFHLAVTLLRMDRVDEAAVEIEHVVRTWRRNPSALALWGVVAFEQDRLDEAERRLRAAVELDPHNLQALEHLFVIYQRREDRPRACRTFFVLQSLRDDLAEMRVSECDEYR